MHIVIPDDYQDAVRHLDCFAKLRGHDVTIFNDTVKDVDTLSERLRDADALVLIRERTSIDDALLVRLPRLKLISQTGRGTAHIDMDACARRGIEVAVGTGSPYAPAELTWALVLAAMRRIPHEVAHLRAGRWQHLLGTTVRNRNLGIFGYGKIGSLVAGFGRAFGMRVLVWGREGSQTRARNDGYDVAASQQELFESSDVLSLHLRLTGETSAIVTAADLARMKRDALLVNTGRAELIESGALVAALRAGRPGRAAIDVYEDEPATNDPLLSLDNVICTPHLGYVEKDSYELYFGQAFDNVIAFEKGAPALPIYL
ncbi:MAG TPA: D-2-hydroxyacid dehydrogenase family protein [Thermoanaerobaculia bacterium]|nr:D-2-hydroxyacid dehydrogenase family protein [Thermoanaerobaculia bacterium]